MSPLGRSASVPYRDRRDAGRRLVEPLREALDGAARPLLLALPRGGVPVAAPLAAELPADLDVLVVAKVGVPGSPELAMGAVASGGVAVRNEVVLRRTRVPADRVEEAFRAAAAGLAQREIAWRGTRPPAPVAGRVVVLVDDGLATGATMRAAVDCARARAPERVLVAVPVGSSAAVADLRLVADDVVCPLVPRVFHAVGLHYVDFTQTADEEVREALRQWSG